MDLHRLTYEEYFYPLRRNELADYRAVLPLIDAAGERVPGKQDRPQALERWRGATIGQQRTASAIPPAQLEDER
jgi:hypothetical protein